MIRVHLYITGTVQGVFYRQNTKNKAIHLNIKGWVRNLDDGRVEIIAEGEKEKINELIDWTHKGPEHAEVKNVNIEFEEYRAEFSDFSIT